MKLRYLLITALLFFSGAFISLEAQIDSLTLKSFKPEFRRQLNHDYIDEQQDYLLSADGTADNRFEIAHNDEASFLLTRVIKWDIDVLQYKIEKDSLLDHRLKMNYLTGLNNTLKYINANYRAHNFNMLYLPEVIKGLELAFAEDAAGRSVEPAFSRLPYQGINAALASQIFDSNEGVKKLKELAILKFCAQYPEKTFATLKAQPNVSFADSLIKIVGRKYPAQLYDYAQARGTGLGKVIYAIKDDSFIQTVAQMANSKSGQQFFPFLDNILKGAVTIDELENIQYDSVAFYKMLVKTQIDYYNRMINGDTALNFRQLTTRLKKEANDQFITTINGLHNENNTVRFKSIQNLSAEELYYLAVLSDGLIYTSSYTSGVYPLMMKKIGNRGDSLLLKLNFDHYRKFIAQAAAYNTLSSFLATFPSLNDASDLMNAFVSFLEKTQGLEDGVDVADSYASIYETNPKLATEVLTLVKANLERNTRTNNKKGISIYNILLKLFLSADPKNNIDLTKELGIPPVYNVPFSSLLNDKGEVVIQVFFYGDQDGRNIFNGFLKMFPPVNWSIDGSNPQWVTIKSKKGKPVTIFANRALDEEQGLDAKAQEALNEYLAINELEPTVTIHRGHSYYSDATIAQMWPSSKVVFMGSCGGFHLIDAILKKADDAHIIASKQIGRTSINRPFFELLTEKLRNGNDIDWIPFWKEFKSRASAEGFEDYIPPYKNLGAIFIKAYNKTLGPPPDSETDDAKAF